MRFAPTCGAILRYESRIHNRRSYRAREFDYSHPGGYFLTICTREHMSVFGHVCDDQVVLNFAGDIVAEEWQRTSQIWPEVTLDAFVVMPNHLHCILVIEFDGSKSYSVGSQPRFVSPSKSVGSMVRGFKAASTRRIRELTGDRNRIVWQRNYYDHIIRDERDLDRIRAYIANNPSNWRWDEEARP